MPEDPSLLVKRASALLALQRYEDALKSYDRALLTNPRDVVALNDRGNALLRLNRYQDALESYDRALALEPNNVTLLGNRGHLLGELRRPQDALASYDRALALEPKLVPVLTNRGNALLELLRNEDAIESYDRALAIDPGYAAAHNNRANVLQSLRRYEEAARSFIRLTALEPDHDYAIGNLLTCQLHSFDWEGAASSMTVVENAIRQGKRAIAPFAFLAASESPEAQLQCARIFVAHKYPASRTPLWTGKRYRHDRIRVAYLSADLREHAVAHLIIGIFENHDRRRFETTAVSFGPQTDDAMQRRAKAAFERFFDVRRQSDGGVAKLLNDLEIDIAVDLNGFTQENRTGILAHRPAPIQVNYLGYPGTMGAPYIDYIVADEFLIPGNHRASYSERVVYMPDCYQSNDSTRRIAERVPTRSEAGLPETGFVFCCFNNHYKITPKVFDVWMRLLGRVDGSVLWLLEVSDEARRAIRRETEARGIEPDRLRFAPRMKQEEHLARHRLADLFLDTLPYNAHTTASDALWAGLPVVTCRGTTFAGRVAGSLLRAVWLPELITDNLQAYETLAFELATDPARLREVKNRLAHNRLAAPLFDTDRFRKHLEAAYVEMWERYQRGDPPASFAVNAVASSMETPIQ
jgi:predicted O-linked N-acetylglucosamine transferase (SPINDLY family)